MTWWAWGLLWVLGSITGAAVHAAMCYARDLREEREDRMRKAVALRNGLAVLQGQVGAFAERCGQLPDAAPLLDAIEAAQVEALRTGLPYDPEARA